MNGFFVQLHMKMVADNVQDMADDLHHLLGAPHIVEFHLRIDDVSRDETGLILRQQTPCSLFHNLQRFQANLVLMTVKTLDFRQKRVMNRQPFLHALYGKMDMVTQIQIQIIAQGLSKRNYRIVNNLIGCLDTFQRHLREQFFHVAALLFPLEDIDFLYLLLLYGISRFLLKSQPAPHHHNLPISVVVRADKIVVNYLIYLHFTDTLPSNTIQNPP